jgi:hypothetical protein
MFVTPASPHPSTPSRLASVLIALALAVALVACGSAGPQLSEITPLEPGLKPTGLVLLPVALTVPGTTALDIAARTGDAAQYMMVKTDLPILGPFDFTLLKAPDEAHTVSADTDMLSRATELGFDLRNAVAIHVLVTENRATNVRDIQDVRKKDPKDQKTYRQHGLDSTVRVELGVYEIMRGHKLGGLVVETQDDPTDFQPGGDPRPGITRAIQLALDRLLETSGAVLRGRGQRRTHGDGMVDSVPALMAWHAQDLPSWTDLHREQQDVVREAEALGLWDRFAPGLSVREVHDASASNGVLVHTAVAPLQVGDVVLTVRNQPVSARYQIDRQLQQCGQSPCPVLVQRAGQRVELTVQWPALPPAP